MYSNEVRAVWIRAVINAEEKGNFMLPI